MCPAILHTSKIPGVQTFLNSWRTSPLSNVILTTFLATIPPPLRQFRIGKVSLEARRKVLRSKKTSPRERRRRMMTVARTRASCRRGKIEKCSWFFSRSQLGKIGQELRHLCHDQTGSRDSCCPLSRTLLAAELKRKSAPIFLAHRIPINFLYLVYSYIEPYVAC